MCWISARKLSKIMFGIFLLKDFYALIFSFIRNTFW